jgi:hypothetical protein
MIRRLLALLDRIAEAVVAPPARERYEMTARVEAEARGVASAPEAHTR